MAELKSASTGGKKMVKKLCAFLCMGLGVPATAHGASAPKELYGKSVVVSWSENLESKHLGESQMEYHMVSHVLSIYISSAGRAFTRLQSASPGSTFRRRGQGASIDQDPAGGAGHVVVRFEGREILADSKFDSGARRVGISFNDSYANCSVRIIQGKEGGAKTIVRTGLGGRIREIQSIQTATPSCSVKDGNVFGGSS
jgi:hypothetical protein